MWHADVQEVEQLSKIFKATLSPNSNTRKEANDALSHAKLQPQFQNYLCYLLVTESPTTTPDVRAAAGVNLKNGILKRTHPVGDFLKGSIFTGLSLPHSTVRNITGNVITAIFSSDGLDGCPEMIPQLLQISESSETPESSKEAACSALAKICEDSRYTLIQPFQGQVPASYILQKLLALMYLGTNTTAMKTSILQCFNFFLPTKSQAVLLILDKYLQALFNLALDESPDVRKNVCTAFLLVLEFRPDMLVPHLDGVVSYCVQLVQDHDESVALEACEFLLALSELNEKTIQPALKAQLNLMLPVLLLKMVYSDELLVLMEILDEKDNAAVADNPEDIRPNMAKSKEAHGAGKGKGSTNDKGSANEHDESDDDGYESGSDDEDELEQWDLRRCSAATLDATSLKFPQEVVRITLPILEQKIVSAEWPIREAAILAFGAISKSCIEYEKEKLCQLVPFLVDRMRDPESRVRQIACWTVGRYSTWVAEEAHEGGQYASYFQPTFEAISLLTLDPKKIVQEAACSALSQFVEATDVSLFQYYVGPMMELFAQCFASYQRKNLLILYDCVSTFVDKIGPEMFGESPQHANTLLPPLLHNWQLLDDQDNDLWPLLECMSIVAATMGEAFAPYAMPVYERAVKILANAVQLHKDVHTDPSIEAPEKDFMVTSLDLIDGLVQGFKEHSVDLMKQHGANLMELVLACLEDHDEDVRQLAYALLGDLAIFTCQATVVPYLAQLLVLIGNEINNHSYTTFAVVNNAIWSLGEISIKIGGIDNQTDHVSSLGPYSSNLVDLLVPLLNSSEAHDTVVENAAICLGRLGFAGASAVIAPRLPEVIYVWSCRMRDVVENEEKETGIMGMIHTIQSSPDVGMGGLTSAQGRKNLAAFLGCIGNYQEPLESLKQMIFQVLVSYHEVFGGEWESKVMKLVDSDVRGFIQSTYNV